MSTSTDREPWVEYYRDNLDEMDYLVTSWAFGPQGHPASFRVHVGIFQSLNCQPVIQVINSASILGLKPDKILFNDIPLKDFDYLIELLEFGEDIDRAFGNDPYWWRCKDKCHSYFCEECLALRNAAEETTKEFYTRNKFPEPPKEIVLPIKKNSKPWYKFW